MHSQAINSSILKILYQAKQEKHMNKKIMTITLVQHLWFANNQVRIDQVQLLSIEYLWKQLDHKKNVFKEYVNERHEVMCEIR
jgi:hypothetical protein